MKTKALLGCPLWPDQSLPPILKAGSQVSTRHTWVLCTHVYPEGFLTEIPKSQVEPSTAKVLPPLSNGGCLKLLRQNSGVRGSRPGFSLGLEGILPLPQVSRADGPGAVRQKRPSPHGSDGCPDSSLAQLIPIQPSS